MKKSAQKIIHFFLILIIAAVWTGGVQGESVMKQLPCDHDGQKWRIAYVLMEESNNNVKNLSNLVEGLESSRWIRKRAERKDPFPIDKSTEKQTIALWRWLQKEDTSDYLEFVKSYYPNEKQRKNLDQYTEFIKEDVKKRKIDLIVVMGDLAAEELTKVNCETKMMMLATNNAVKSKIVNGITASGKDTVWAHMYPDRIKNQIRVFHDLFKFDTLGIVYEDSEKGRIKGNVEDIREVAKERGFRLVEKHLADTKDHFNERALKTYVDLADEVDAVYFTRYEARDSKMIESLMQPFYEKHIPIFSSVAANVQWGMFMSVTDTNDEGAGEFYADVFGKALTETSLKDINQVYNVPPKIIINLEAAKKIGYDLDFDMLSAADEIYLKTIKE